MPKQPTPPQTEYNFKTALMDFQKLKQQNALPYKMLVKLQYLENKILGRKLVLEEYKELPQYQFQALQQCDSNSQMSLFTSIVKCLSGKQVIIYFKQQKAYIKKQQAFSIWKKCYISCDSSLLQIKKKASKKTNYYQFKIKGLKVSRKYMQYKGRMCFGLMYQSKKYMLGFQQETACERIFRTLKQLVKENQPELENGQGMMPHPKSQGMIGKEKHPSKPQLSTEQKPTTTKSSTKQSPPIPQHPTPQSMQYLSIPSKLQESSSRQILQFQQQQSPSNKQSLTSKQQQLYEMLRQQIRRENLSNDNQYKLIKNFQIGRLLLWSPSIEQGDKEVKTKMSIILSLKKVDAAWLLEQYLQMKSWNLQVQQSKIIHKISPNSYKLYLQFRKHSIISLARWAIVIITSLVIQHKTYLILRSCQQLTQQQLTLGNYMSTVRAKTFHQTIQISQRSQHDQKTLMTVLTVSDFGGYCSRQDNLGMIVGVLSNMQNFYNFLLQQAIVKQYESEGGSSRLFQYSSREGEKQREKERGIRGRQASNHSIVSGMSQQSIISYHGDSNVRKKSQTVSQLSYQQQGDSLRQNHYQQEKQFQLHKSRKHTSVIKPHQTLSSIQLQQLVYQQFMKEFSSYQQTTKGTQKLVQFIKQKVQEKYYLRHKFKLQEKYIPTAQKYNNNPPQDNWLLQKGKWRVSGVELIFTNEQILAQQKNVIKLILKQLSSSVMSGKNIMNMSLPVEIFQDKSFLQKLAEMFGLFPYYFNIAAKQKNIVKQITTVTQAFAYATTICPNIQKPFNPILGETYQCTIGGVTLSFQQVSHHPPISAFYIKTDQFECYGNQYPNVDIGLNTAVAKNTNPIHIHFYETNTSYVGYGQDFEVGGLIFGQRTYRNSGKINVFQEKNEILCQLSYGKAKKHIYEFPKKLKTGEIIGGVFKVSNAFTKRFKQAQWKNFEGIKYDQKIEELAKIHGNWMGDFYIDGVKVRGMYDVTPYKPVKDIYVLPSDCSYRLDVFYKKMGDMKKSQQWKEVMENSQRKERKLREEHNGVKH